MHAVLQSNTEFLSQKGKTRPSFDISEDVVEHREPNNNSSAPAGDEDLSVHAEQVER